MNDTQHTPGPCKAIEDRVFRGRGMLYDIVQGERPEHYEFVASRVPESHKDLLAAAPDLLAACEAASKAINDAKGYVSAKVGLVLDKLLTAERQARAAIAKAKPRNVNDVDCSVCNGNHKRCATQGCNNAVECDPEKPGESWVYCDSCDAEMKGGA